MTTTDVSVDEGVFTGLRRFNTGMGFLHLLQAIVVILLANEFALPVTATFLDNAPGLAPPQLFELFEIRIGWGVALFLLMSAVAHFVIASPGVFPWYRANLLKNRNYARWIEYSFSSSLMVVLIAMLTGISEIVALLAIAGVNAAMILFGLLVEKYEEPGNPNMLSFWFGSLVGIIPWIGMAIYLWSPSTDGSPPGFVYGIFISLFIFFNSFAVNMWLQYHQIGRWRDYIFGERMYVWLSLVAKSLLAWQVFAGTLTG